MDDFSDASSWMAVASGEARLDLSSERCASGHALRMDFDFKGGGGFVVARKEIPMPLPEACTFRFRIRGAAPCNTFEFKLVDRTGKNVWRWQEERFEFTAAGREIALRKSQIEFAWGPAGGGVVRDLGAVEFVISAGPGGRGTVWIEDFQLEDRTIHRPPVAIASSAAPGTAAESVLSPGEPTVWRSAPGESEPWLQLDFHAPREYGGIVVDWADEWAGRRFSVQASDDLASWRSLYCAEDDRGPRSFIGLPGGESRYLRIAFECPAAVRGIEVQPFDFARSPVDFFHSVAARSPRGWYPRYFLREQSYWTCAGALDGQTCALINEEGMIEPDKGSFSVEPFLEVDGRAITWADVAASVHLESGGLPIPTVRWRQEGIELETTCFATGSGDAVTLLIRYRVKNHSGGALGVRLHVAIRPFQVNPPWQSWRDLGGVSAIRHLCFEGGFARVNGQKIVVPLQTPAACGACAFEQGDIPEYLSAGLLPPAVEARDGNGFASGAMRFEMELASGESREVYLAAPFGEEIDGKRALAVALLDGPAEFAKAVREMRERLGGVEFQMPEGVAREAAATFRSAAGQILINRDGPAIQPGPRRYTRSWIRDGVIMGAALHRIGERRALREFLEWFAPHQREDGFVPCCVDRSGPDWLVEHDSHGQFIYGVRECFRFSGDRVFLQAMWPHVRSAARFIGRLRAERLTPEYQTPEKRDRYGLLPESASHEGYLSHPVHAYWDDFWALRGLMDASAIAAELGHEGEAKEFSALAESFRKTLRASIEAVIATRNLDYIPGSVEWADFDPTATANAVTLLPGMGDLPEKQLGQMFDRFMSDFRKKRSGEMDWTNYTAYEIRIIGALVRLGRRSEALELLEFFLADRRPPGWNQWPEISWKDPRSPGHLGDVPHTWIASEWMLVFAALFAYEREEDDALVLGAGVDGRWLDGEGFALRGLPTWFGPLDFAMRREGSGLLHVEIGGKLRRPGGGFVLRPPSEGAICFMKVNGVASREFSGGEARIMEFPARAVLSMKGACV